MDGLITHGEPREYRIYLNKDLTEWALVDEVDYAWAIRWHWHIKKQGKYAPARKGSRKRYAFRQYHPPETHRAYRTSLYLHVEIMKRTGIEPPSPLHTIVDHRDGKSFDCRRHNLRWATPKQNAANRNGKYAYEELPEEPTSTASPSPPVAKPRAASRGKSRARAAKRG